MLNAKQISANNRLLAVIVAILALTILVLIIGRTELWGGSLSKGVRQFQIGDGTGGKTMQQQQFQIGDGTGGRGFQIGDGTGGRSW